MDVEPPFPATSPYLLASRPTSSGRVLLAHGFEHYCALHWGLSGQEVAAAFAGTGDARVREYVAMSADLLGGVLARGLVRAWTRPFGGGDPTELRMGAWELDQFERRFAASALDPKRPFDPDAAPTHWIFVDLDGWNDVLEASVRDIDPQVRRRAPKGVPIEAAAPQPTVDRLSPLAEERLVRLPEVKRRTGLSRSSIYRKMDARRFPQSVPLSENAIAWWDSDVAAWIERPS